MNGGEASVREIDEVTKEVQATVSPSEFAQKYDTRVKRLMGSAKIKGFRPGKAPRQIIEKLHGKAIEAEVVSELVSDRLLAVIKEHSLDLVGMPDISVEPLEADKTLRFSARLFLQPRPTITGYDSFSIEAASRTVEEADIAKVLDALCERKATFEPLAFRQEARLGDIAEIKVKVEIEGRDSSPAEPATVELGKGVLPLEVEKALEGLAVGNSRTVEITVPEDHSDVALRGQQAVYHVQLEKLLEKKVPALSDEIAETLYPGAKSVLDLRVKVREELERAAERDSQDEVISQIFDSILAQNSFAVPQAMIDDEIRAVLVDQGVVDPSKVEVSRLSVERFRELLGERAERRVRLRTIVDQIAAQEGVTVGDAEIDARVSEISERLGVSIEQVHRVYQREENRAQLRSDLLRDKVLELLRGRAQITFKAQDKSPDETQPAA